MSESFKDTDQSNELGAPAEEEIRALEESIGYATENRDAANEDLERWRESKTTDPSHFEYRLPEIRNRVSAAEHTITSNTLDIELLKAGPETTEEADGIIRDFITDQVVERKARPATESLSQIDRNLAPLEKNIAYLENKEAELESEINEIGEALAHTTDEKEIKRLRRNRNDARNDKDLVNDTHAQRMREMSDFEQQKAPLQKQIEEIKAAGISDEELPTSIEEDPDFEACLDHAKTYASKDSKLFKENLRGTPEEGAVKLFKERFPQKAAYYERMQQK